MRNPFRLVAVCCLLATGAHGQEGDGYGFMNVVNLIPGDIPAEVTVDGKELLPDGMKSGDFTGWFVIPIGTKSLTIELGKKGYEKPAIEKASGNIEVGEGQSNVVAIFLQPDSRVKADGVPYPPKIRIKSFPAFSSSGFGLRFVSTCATDKRFQIGPLRVDAKALQPIEIEKWSGAGFEVMHNGKAIGKTAGSSEPGSFYLFVGEGEGGDFMTVLTRSDAQVTPPWMKKKIKPGPNP